jgi:hypothetical protein
MGESEIKIKTLQDYIPSFSTQCPKPVGGVEILRIYIFLRVFQKNA